MKRRNSCSLGKSERSTAGRASKLDQLLLASRLVPHVKRNVRCHRDNQASEWRGLFPLSSFATSPQPPTAAPTADAQRIDPAPAIISAAIAKLVGSGTGSGAMAKPTREIRRRTDRAHQLAVDDPAGGQIYLVEQVRAVLRAGRLSTA